MSTFNIDDNKLELKSDSYSNLNLYIKKNVKFIDNIHEYMNKIKKLNKQIKKIHNIQ